MDRESIFRLIRRLNRDHDAVEPHVVGEWVMASCPLSPWTHQRGTDRNVSFGIKIAPEGESKFNCFTCKKRGSILRLLRFYERFSDDHDFEEWVDDLQRTETLGPPLPAWGDRGARQRRIEPPAKVDPEILDIYDDAAGHPYLRKRNITDRTAKLLQLRVDTDKAGVERILFPLLDRAGNFYGFTGRATSDDATPKVRNYLGVKASDHLLGEHLIPEELTYVTLVEGQFDLARMVQLGFPCVAAMTSNISIRQAARLKYWGVRVYCFFDNDKAGMEGRKQVSRLLSMHQPVLKVRYPDGVKDPDQLTRRQVKRMIATARLL